MMRKLYGDLGMTKYTFYIGKGTHACRLQNKFIGLQVKEKMGFVSLHALTIVSRVFQLPINFHLYIYLFSSNVSPNQRGICQHITTNIYVDVAKRSSKQSSYNSPCNKLAYVATQARMTHLYMQWKCRDT
jgi:hypothetical protein